MKQIRRTSIIRQRGQLTIPGAIRRALSWAQDLAVVTISISPAGAIMIQSQTEKKKLDHEEFWKHVAHVRKLTATGKGGSGSAFIIRDRQQRR